MNRSYLFLSALATSLIALAAPNTAFAQAADRASSLLKRMDVNNNGQLEPGEVPSQYRLLIDRHARQAGLDTSKPIPIAQLSRMSERGRGDGDGNDQNDERRDGERRRGDGRGRDEGRGGDERGREERRRDGDRRGGGEERPWWDRGDGERGRGERGERGERDRGDRRRRDERSAANTSTVPGFGADPKDAAAPLVPGFDGKPLGPAGQMSLEDRFDARILSYVQSEILDNYDRNRNSILDADEWNNVAWGDEPKQDDKNGDGALTREELAARMARRWGYGDKLRRPGAGAVVFSPGGAAFTVNANTPGGQRDGRSDDRMRSYAESLVRQYDANKNGYLEPDESKGMRGDLQTSDANKDGRITSDEIAQKLASYGSGGWKGGPGPSAQPGLISYESRDRRSPRGSDSKSSDRKSYRFLTPAERLPKGIPDWFLRKDASADGQVSMVEYSTTWTNGELADFEKHDLNSDGVITPEECLAVTK